MIRLFKHYLPTSVVLLGVIEFVLLLVSAEAAWQLRAMQIGIDAGSPLGRSTEILTYAVVVYVIMVALGLYQVESYRSLRQSASRMVIALVTGMIVLSVLLFLLPDISIWRSVSLYAVLLSFGAVLAARWLIGRLVGWSSFRKRIVVMGAGARAARLGRLADDHDTRFTVAAFVKMTDEAPEAVDAVCRRSIQAFDRFVAQHRADEVVLALEERRGALPLDDLLKVKLTGVRVSELSTFLERETGRVDLRSASPSWLIFSDGFSGARRWAILSKRVLDVLASAVLLIVTSPILLVTAAAIKLTSPGPIFYRQERVGQYGRTYEVIKFRSMRNDAEKDGQPQWAQARDPRVTAVGRFIRATRIDEIPQIINVFTGDMSFVGPRPERPFFVADLATKIPYYQERHVVKPGITGWAQINYPYGASLDDARHKLEYDLYYVKNYSLFLDLLILVQTVRVVVFPDGVR